MDPHDRKIDALLEEYRSLREETVKRIELQNSNIALALGITGVGIGGGVTLISTLLPLTDTTRLKYVISMLVTSGSASALLLLLLAHWVYQTWMMFRITARIRWLGSKILPVDLPTKDDYFLQDGARPDAPWLKNFTEVGVYTPLQALPLLGMIGLGVIGLVATGITATTVPNGSIWSFASFALAAAIVIGTVVLAVLQIRTHGQKWDQDDADRAHS